MNNCGVCKYAHGLRSTGKIRCFLAHKTIGDLHLLLRQQENRGNVDIPAPEWCPKNMEE